MCLHLGQLPKALIRGAGLRTEWQVPFAFPFVTRESTHSALLKGVGVMQDDYKNLGRVPSALGLCFPVASGTFLSLTLAILVIVNYLTD